MESQKYNWNSVEARKILKNAFIFLAPALIIFLTQLQAGVPLRESLNSIYLWGINTLIDITRKFLEGK